MTLVLDLEKSEAPDGFEFEVNEDGEAAARPPKTGDTYIDQHGSICRARGDNDWYAIKRFIIKRKPWRASGCEFYWCFDGLLRVFCTEDTNCHEDNFRFTHGNYFKSEVEANNAVAKIKEILSSEDN